MTCAEIALVRNKLKMENNRIGFMPLTNSYNKPIICIILLSIQQEFIVPFRHNLDIGLVFCNSLGPDAILCFIAISVHLSAP